MKILGEWLILSNTEPFAVLWPTEITTAKVSILGLGDNLASR
jgi:dolichol kinase